MRKIVKIFVLLQIIDILTTIVGINVLHIAEANIFMSQFGMVGMIIIKVIAIIFISSVLLLNKKIPNWAGFILIFISCFAPINNIVVIISSLVA